MGLEEYFSFLVSQMAEASEGGGNRIEPYILASHRNPWCAYLKDLSVAKFNFGKLN